MYCNYLVYNKSNKTVRVAGSLKKISTYTGISVNRLYYIFSRLKLNDVTINEFHVIKIKFYL
jgi:hypothetical protein